MKFSLAQRAVLVILFHNIFQQNSILHPYLCLQQMDAIKNPKVDSFIVGASNALYQHQRQLYDVVVDVSMFL